MGFVIGRKGSSIREIEVESGAKLNSHRDRTGFLVSGNTEQRARARELVQQKVVSVNRDLSCSQPLYLRTRENK